MAQLEFAALRDIMADIDSIFLDSGATVQVERKLDWDNTTQDCNFLEEHRALNKMYSFFLTK